MRSRRDPDRVRRARPRSEVDGGRRSFVNEQVARYKHLGDVVVIDAIPKSPSGKILRRELRDP